MPLRFDRLVGEWALGDESPEPGDEWLVDGHLFRVREFGRLDRGSADLVELALADAVFGESEVT